MDCTVCVHHARGQPFHTATVVWPAWCRPTCLVSQWVRGCMGIYQYAQLVFRTLLQPYSSYPLDTSAKPPGMSGAQLIAIWGGLGGNFFIRENQNSFKEGQFSFLFLGIQEVWSFGAKSYIVTTWCGFPVLMAGSQGLSWSLEFKLGMLGHWFWGLAGLGQGYTLVSGAD